jgi:neural Wiskott-Aldrich syndrome protein
VPPPLRSTGPAAPVPPLPVPAPAPTQARPLVLHCEGETVAVTKERFIIGRGKQVSDLTIRDPNVSRQHAVVEFIGGVFYMVDMGSTNGIEFSGQRVHRKAIQHGDVFKICDHQIHCTYQ